MVDRCSSKLGDFFYFFFSPLTPLPSSAHSRKGLHGHRRRPGVNLSRVATETGELRKKKKGEEARRWELRPSGESRERSGLEWVFSCIIVSVSMPLSLFQAEAPLTHGDTHTDTHTPPLLLLLLSAPTALFTTSDPAVCSLLH